MKKSLQKKHVQKTTIKKQITSISFNKISYPLPENLCLLHNANKEGAKSFPTNLIHAYDIQQTCTHGNAYSSENQILFQLVE